MLSLTFDASGLDAFRRGLRRLPSALDDELERALRQSTRAIAREARQRHEYTDRTGRLTRSITSYENDGTWSAGTLSGLVGASQHYASYVEEGTTRMRAYRYLGNAWVNTFHDTEERVNDALERALRRAGLAT